MTIVNSIVTFKKENQSNDKFSYSFLFHSTKAEELVNIIKKKLDNINKKINNSFKKKYINDRIYSLITHLESNYNNDEDVNAIFFIDKNVNIFSLSKDDLKFIKKWNITKFYMDYDEFFQTEYFIKLFSTNLLKIVFKFDKSSYDIIELDSTKSRKVEGHSSTDESSISELISKYKPIVIYGMNQVLKKLKNSFDDIIIELKNMNKEEICEIIFKKEISDNMNIFKSEVLDHITNESVVDKIIFGKKEIGQGIENYMVKKLFINTKLLAMLKNKADNSLLNFTIIEIKSLETGDPGYILNKNYGGMVAIKYY